MKSKLLFLALALVTGENSIQHFIIFAGGKKGDDSPTAKKVSMMKTDAKGICSVDISTNVEYNNSTLVENIEIG